MLQVSDPHFGTERPLVLAALESFAAALQPDLLLLSGDITQRATRKQFAAAEAFIRRLHLRVLLAVPGNHDIPLFNPWARVFAPYARFQRAFGSVLEPSFENADVLVIGLNTTRWYRHADGELSAMQVARAVSRLQAAAPRQWRCVLLHHPVAVTLPKDQENVLHGVDAALHALSAAGADMIVGGHIHLPFVLPLHAQRPGLARPMWAVQAGTSISRRVRAQAPNSVNVFRTGADLPPSPTALNPMLRRCVVERWDCVKSGASFELAETQASHSRMEA